MKTAPTRRMYAYWNARRGSRLAPERGDIEPGVIREILGDSFIVSFDADGDHPFRLAGTRVCALFGHELKGKPFIQFWDLASRNTLRTLAASVADEGGAIVAGVGARTAQGSRADLELLLLPLYHCGSMRRRMLGVLAPITVPYWLGAEHISNKFNSLAATDDERDRTGLVIRTFRNLAMSNKCPISQPAPTRKPALYVVGGTQT